MSNRSLPDRAVTPEWMGAALRIARMGKPWLESRHLLEISMRDHVDSETGRSKAATVLAHCWLKSSEEAGSLVEWATEHASGDMRPWHLGVLLGNYAFFDERCAEIGRRIGLSHEIDTGQLRSVMKGAWGDRVAVDVATRSSIRTLRSFEVLHGDHGDSASDVGNRIPVESDVYPWLVHAVMVGRGVMEIDLRDVFRAPELFMFALPRVLNAGYPNLERFTEGGGRVVIRRVVKRTTSRPVDRQLPIDRQLTLDV